ncbi:hypothetical protein KNO15_21880 [Leifsonia shinshuensis]|uniref:hypothetical protein n=1 Tax=Leifsonia shinshuensis TaxID=150026 RepID=UPI001F5151DC|nr:hypothetical protein [Leifsonia shinshuensis]MCI0159360.1 hypothetical protein [Leifsonia shinshuensis]
MYLDRNAAPGELTITLDRDTYLRLLRRAADSGLTPEAFVERLTRDAYGRAAAHRAPETGEHSPDAS